MTISVPELISLGTYFVLMMAIGLYAYKTSTSDVSEYMLGGRNLHPAVGALSAGASDMSGWMLMGLPGAIYVSGFSAAWIAVGLVIGAYLNYRFVAPRLRIYTEMADDSITIPDFFEKRFHDSSHALRTISALVIIVFFTVYTSSGIVAGGKLFESAFGLNYQLGLFVTAGVVLAYTVVGGFLAVSLTDFVQGCIMFIALILVPVIAYFVIGGWSGMESAITSAPSYVDADSGAVGPARSQFFDMWPESMTVVGLVSLLAWGLGYFGQPHIIVRFMAIRSLKDIKTARIIGMSWMLVTVIGAVFVGAVGVAYVQQHDLGAQLTDSEAIFILLSQIIFHPLVAGFLLAAILAAIMSTISSQLLVSSSSITEDVYKTFFRREASQSELVMIGRVATVVVSLVAIALAFDPNSNILDLVSNAWAGFGSAFGPIILLSLFWRHLTRDGALAGMIVGAVTVLVWLYVPLLPAEGGAVPLETLVYAMIPGFLLSGLAAYLVSVIGRSVKPRVAAGFDDMSEVMNDAP
ncbi:sodium/proline symporter PutP [Hyphomonas sp.]|uniref:sodium/proline symporter PutP n=2 Tax=unclassified Hyphomonas TaxID=2630699 RepID=UPI000E05D119|nr:sodium/proline symporter PutP [Hyphomonas sp.]RCL89381.1 MAG: sodium/proline symporter PutP [Hyphomonas sp.]